MKKFITKTRKKFVAVAMCVLTLVSMVGTMPVFAAETTSGKESSCSTDNMIQPLSGVETIPYGVYNTGGFTFTNNNLTKVKTIAGSKISFTIAFKKASIDAGIGNVKLKFQVRDIYGNAISPVYEMAASPNGYDRFLTIDDLNLGYTGRKVQFWYDASSTGQSNGNYRSIQVVYCKTFVQ